MTKEQIGKEIKELIRSIKTHYTFVEEEDRIPLIELELITSKIRKLYEKSIINNYLYSIDDGVSNLERFSRNASSNQVIETKQELRNDINSADKVQEILPAADFMTIDFANIPAEANPHETSSKQPVKSLKEIKTLIGINDKFLLINNLFARNDSDFKMAIEYLSQITNLAQSKEYLNALARQNSWNTESYAFVRLIQIVEKRFK